MPATKSDILKHSDDDIRRIITEDFKVSEMDLEGQFKQDWQCNKMFHCLDLDETIPSTRLDDNAIRRSLTDRVDTNRAYVPYGRSVILSAESIISNSLFPDYDNYMRLDPQEEGDEKSVRRMQEMVLFYRREGNYIREVLLTIRQALKYQKAILYTGWRRDFAIVPKVVKDKVSFWDHLTGRLVGSPFEEGEHVEYERVFGGIDRLEYWAVNNFNFRVDPLAGHDDFDSCEFAGITYRMSKREMRQKAETKFFDKAVVDKIKDDEPPNSHGESDETLDYEERLRRDQKQGSADEGGEDYESKYYVRVQQYHTATAEIFLINGKYIVRKRETIGYPFHKISTFQEEGMFKGNSLARYLLPIQHDINVVFRQLRTQQDRAVNPRLVLDEGLFDSPKTAEMYANNPDIPIVFTGRAYQQDPRMGIFYVTVPSNTAPDMWNSINLELDMGRRMSAISENMQGAAVGGSRTKGEADLIQQGVGSRHDDMRKRFEKALIVEPCYREMRLIHMNQREEVRVRVIKEEASEWRNITPADLVFRTSPDVTATGMSAMNARMSSLDLFVQAQAAVMGHPLMAQFAKPLATARKIYKMTGTDPDELLLDPQGVPEKSLDQDLENILLSRGRRVPVRPEDDHEEHFEKVARFINEDPAFELVPPEGRDKLVEHGKTHQQMLAMLKAGVPVAQLPNPDQGVGGGAPGGPGAVPGQPGQPGQAPPPVANAATAPQAAPQPPQGAVQTVNAPGGGQ